MIQKYHFFSLSKAIDITIKSISVFKKELHKSKKGQLLNSKIQLEQTVSHLTEEIENLSLKNQQLMDNRKSKQFFDQYTEVLQELHQLKQEQEILVDMRYEDLNNLRYTDIPPFSLSKIKRPTVDEITTLKNKHYGSEFDNEKIEDIYSAQKPSISKSKWI